MSERNCFACAHSGIEPDDMDLTCGHPKARQPFGEHVLRGPIKACGPTRVLFEQHPGRTPEGALRPTRNVESKDQPHAEWPYNKE